MSDAVIVAAVRTPVGKRNGGLSGVHPVDLSAHVLTALAERSGVDPEVVDDVIWGCVSQIGEQSFDIARNAVLAAGWPESVPGRDRRPAVRVKPAGGALRRRRRGQRPVRRGRGGRRRVDEPGPDGLLDGAQAGDPSGPACRPLRRCVPNQGVGAEMIAERWGFSRTQLDEFSLGSHAKAAAAIDDGRFAGQIAPVKLEDGTVVDTDEGVRRGGSLEDDGRAQARVPSRTASSTRATARRSATGPPPC